MNLGPTELVLVLVIFLSYVIPIWAIIDAVRRPEPAFAAIGTSKTTQLLILILTALFCGIVGTIVSIVYLVGTRRQLAAVTAS
jgi:hypothetical protein